jgi:two-component system, chemotaxis family, protein-glutamate methylesterase/glutaminase
MGKIRLLIVDDSLFMQKILTDIFNQDEYVEVVGTARDGEEAIAKIATLNPDVVTMDIQMPKMDGLAAVQKIMQTRPVPLVVVSALTQDNAELTLKALDFGAVDYVTKPSGQISLNMDDLSGDLLSKVKAAAYANIIESNIKEKENLQPQTSSNGKIIAIAASTGGPAAVSQVLEALPGDSPAILVVQHMPRGMTPLFARRLNDKCSFPVKEARDGDQIQDGLALIAPGGFHMIITKDKKVKLTLDRPVNYVRPSADLTMMSLAEVNGSKNVGVVLTGMGSDGAMGISAIKKSGGFTIAQDEQSSVVFGMPNVAIQTGCVDVVAALEQIPHEILKACR